MEKILLIYGLHILIEKPMPIMEGACITGTDLQELRKLRN